MIVLHASTYKGMLVAWAEADTNVTDPPQSDPKGPRGDFPRDKPSPYDAGTDRLLEALAHAAAASAPEPAVAEPWFAWLPSMHGKVIPSSPLVGEPPSNGVKPAVGAWRVTGVKLQPAMATELLAGCAGRTTLAQGVVVGATLAFWSNVLKLAGALVARQLFLPGIETGADGFRACWEPVVAGADAQRLAQLGRAMPQAARALAPALGETPATPAQTAVSGVLGMLVDHLVRSALQEPEPPGPAKGRARNGKAKKRSFPSLHDQWLYALTTPDGLMQGDETELGRLAEQVKQWRRPVVVEAAAPFRLCFRLEEPESDTKPRTKRAADDWYVRFLLQAADDPSLLVPAEDAWGRSKNGLVRHGFKPREYLLSTLGQAAGVCPRIESSLKEAAPGGYAVDVSGAHEFLTQKAWLLEQSGFGVLLPAWWTRKGTKTRLSARAVVKAPNRNGARSSFSLSALLGFKWEVALGDQTLTLSELKALAKMKAPLVKVRGQWVQLSAEEIQAALEFWKKKGEQKISARDAVQMALGVGQPPGGLEFEGIEATGWVADLIDRLRGGASFEQVPSPEGFRGRLRPYQERGFSWLSFLRQWGFGACLADDMGLGKTVQMLAAIQHDWEHAAKRLPTLLVCPMSVVGNWHKEAARFTPELPVMVHHGLARTKGPAFKKQAMKHGLVLSSYALLHRDFDILKSVPWAGVILDEAQNIKNAQTKQAQAARALKAEARVALTGTPVENHVGDLWSIMEFLNPGLLGTQAEFRRSFHIPIQAERDPDAARRLQRITGPFILRRVKTDKSIIADLPDKLEMKVFCNLTREQATLYQAVADEAAEAIDGSSGIQRKGIVLATLAKLKQVCNHPAHFLGDNSPIPGRSGKLARLGEMLEEALEAGDRALIFTQFSEMGEILRRHLQDSFGREVLFLHGGVSKPNRDRMVERFQSKNGDAPPLFVLTVKAGGTGLNLTAANHVFHFDRWWNPAVENQATDRAFRIGQSKNVQVHKFVCVGTLEEKIDEMIEQKQKVAGAVVGAGEDWLTKLSTDELRDLFALREEALAE